MPVPIGVHDALAAAGQADAGQAVGRGRAPAHPDATATQLVGTDRGEQRAQVLAQHLGAAPVGRGVVARNLDLPGHAQAAIHAVHDQLAVHHHHGGARGGLGGRIIHGRQRHVVAALGIQADAVARRLCQWQRIGARGNHQRIGGDVALVGLHRLQATARRA